MPIPSIYIPVPSPFSALEAFIDDAAKTYNLSLYRCFSPSGQVESIVTPSTPGLEIGYLERPRAVGKSKGAEGMRQALQAYKTKFQHITAVLVGTRRSDPHGGDNLFSLVKPPIAEMIDSKAFSSKHD